MDLSPASPHPALLGAVVVALALNVGGTLATLVLPGLRGPDKKVSRQAITSWWPVTILWSLPALFGAPVALGVSGLVSLLVLREWQALTPANERHRLLDIIALLTIPVELALVAQGPGPAPFALPFGVGALLLPLLRLRLLPIPGFVLGASRALWGLLLSVLAIAHVPMLFWLPADVGPAGPQGLLAFLLLFVLMNDAIQWMSGKLFGRHPIAPVVSPKKTWEGLIGGLLVNGLIGTLIAPSITPFSPVVAFGVASGLSLLGFFGDLMESAIKRDLGVKDSGDLLPGQGGALDRHDSLLTCAPAFTWMVWALYG
ncbi:MAG: phosphatidate cytidylyltransferase [Deltaproteobacteria bacterium]|nr:phosphatidate cytidylyltransferase [Deltaproteobacteria bacterium]